MAEQHITAAGLISLVVRKAVFWAINLTIYNIHELTYVFYRTSPLRY